MKEKPVLTARKLYEVERSNNHAKYLTLIGILSRAQRTHEMPSNLVLLEELLSQIQSWAIEAASDDFPDESFQLFEIAYEVANAPSVSSPLPWSIYCSAIADAVDEQEHPDDRAVDRMARAMKERLAQKRKEGKSGWDDPVQCTVKELRFLLEELVGFGVYESKEAVDAANYALFLYHRMRKEEAKK